MKRIRLNLNCTPKNQYKVLGNLLVAQKLLGDYLKEIKEDPQVGPENFAELWMEDFGLDLQLKEDVLSLFCRMLLELGKV
jgi:hypothetical protein